MLKPYYSQNLIEAGLDEAGRGCLAGPVVAAAVILPTDYQNERLDDSKKISRKMRKELKEEIMAESLEWRVGIVDNKTIDEINILNASIEAMHDALDQIKTRPDLLLVDGNKFKAYENIPHKCIIKGDGKYMSIAAASILAKTFRDELMEELHDKYPYYAWDQNVGYPTAFHRQAIMTKGITPYHRKSFRLLPEQIEIFS